MAEADSLLPSNGHGNGYGAGTSTPTNNANSPQPTPAPLPDTPPSRVRIVTDPTQVVESNAALMDTDPAKDAFPVLGWDVTDTGGAGHHLCFRGSPWRLFGRDLRWVFGHLAMVPWIVLPMTYATGTPGAKSSGALAVLAQVVMIPFSLVLTVGFLTAAIGGLPPLILAMGILLLFIWIAEKAQGATTREITSPDSVGKDTEAWFL
jgi:hypothetical protein